MLRKALLALSSIVHISLTHARQVVPLHLTSPTVDVGYAVYQGAFNQTTDTTSFLGIRFAAPPVGKLRFQAPQPPLIERSSGVQRADTLSPGCMQTLFGVNMSTPFRLSNDSSFPQKRQSTTSEDCLFLNIWVPGTLKRSAKLPVLVWIHGGGYTGGNVIGTTGDDLIREAGGGLVVVTFDYRLGVFGFLAGEQVHRKGALNAGLLDQQYVLQWVQRHIHLFGGNPNEVTIWGESAGAGSVLQHMIAHAGNTQPPLFKGAISSSLFVPSQYHFNDPIPERIYSEFVQLTGCVNATDTFECLVDVDAVDLQAANVAIGLSGFFGTFTAVPVIDDKFITGSPSRQIESGQLNGERLLAITNTFEGAIFVNATFSAQMTVQDYVSQLFPNFNRADIEAAASQYTRVGALPTTNDKAIAIMGESIFICPTYLLLQSFKGPAFKAEFAIPPGTHGSDIPYYFPDGSPPPFSNSLFDASFAGAMTGFAKFGDPNIHPCPEIITPRWGQFRKDHTEMLFNQTTDSQPDIREVKTELALLKRCAFWKTMSAPAAQ